MVVNAWTQRTDKALARLLAVVLGVPLLKFRRGEVPDDSSAEDQ
ncbi:hypothetical protein [Parabacteroides bouchesdurhonensis]|nr:hypothetical protein [Parabacteroides bouchesdurhonensis]